MTRPFHDLHPPTTATTHALVLHTSRPQATSLFNTEVTLQEYLDKSFYKTASLIAASCRSAAVLRSDQDQDQDLYGNSASSPRRY